MRDKEIFDINFLKYYFISKKTKRMPVLQKSGYEMEAFHWVWQNATWNLRTKEDAHEFQSL